MARVKQSAIPSSKNPFRLPSVAAARLRDQNEDIQTPGSEDENHRPQKRSRVPSRSRSKSRSRSHTRSRSRSRPTSRDKEEKRKKAELERRGLKSPKKEEDVTELFHRTRMQRLLSEVLWRDFPLIHLLVDVARFLYTGKI